jgi:hypothetical protein
LADGERSPDVDASSERAPLGFKIVVGAAAIYLSIRMIQVIAWLVGRLR